ncbi:MAG: hypothetical protein AAGH81_11160 [Bacteroidota bacterium]
MKKLIFAMLLSLMGYSAGYGQLNSYKYIIVPTKFQNFKDENRFRTSTLVKYLFTNEGFNTVYSNSLPEELQEDPCLGLRAELIERSSLFLVKTQLSLTDCNGIVILTSQEGRSKTKEYEQAYREAISEAFGTYRGLKYTYQPVEEEPRTGKPITVSFNNDIKSLESKPQTEVSPKEVAKISEPAEKRDVAVPPDLPLLKEKGILYAQPVDGGYQLVDTTPKVVYVLKSTSAPDVFLVNKDGKNGLVFKNNDKWFIEMDEKGGKVKELNIKF